MTLVLCAYANECFDYKKYEKEILLVHQPHPVDFKLFGHPILREDGLPVDKKHDVLLAGSLTPEYYPLRHRLWWMQHDNKINGQSSLLDTPLGKRF